MSGHRGRAYDPSFFDGVVARLCAQRRAEKRGYIESNNIKTELFSLYLFLNPSIAYLFEAIFFNKYYKKSFIFNFCCILHVNNMYIIILELSNIYQ